MKSWPELIGSGNPEAHNYAAGLPGSMRALSMRAATVPKLVVVESPYRGRSDAETAANVEFARACMADCLKRGEAPFASHLLYTQPGVLDDKIAAERQHGIDAGLAWGLRADLVAVYLDRGVSEGMRYGIRHAMAAWRPIEFRLLYGTIADAQAQGVCLIGELEAKSPGKTR